MFRVHDGRMPAFSWQEKAALRLIRETFKPSELATALAIYGTLTELASNNQADEFKVKRQTVGAMVGRSSVRSVDHYLDCLSEIGLVETRPLVIDGEYKCLVVRLLPTPAMVQSTAVPVQSTAPPPATHRATPCSPLPIRSEESSSKKNLGSELAESPSAPPRQPTPSTDPGDGPRPSPVAAAPLPVEGADRPQSGPVVPGLVTDHENHLNPDQEDKIRKRDRDAQRKEDAERRRKAREEAGKLAAATRAQREEERRFHPERKPEEWTAYDVIHYFIARFREKWPNEKAPGISEPKDPAAVRFRLLHLKGEKQPISAMKEVIDYIFDKWDDGLRERLNWRAHPGLPLIETASIFDRLFDELRHGVPNKKDPKKKIDSWDDEKGKKQPNISGRKLL